MQCCILNSFKQRIIRCRCSGRGHCLVTRACSGSLICLKALSLGLGPMRESTHGKRVTWGWWDGVGNLATLKYAFWRVWFNYKRINISHDKGTKKRTTKTEVADTPTLLRSSFWLRIFKNWIEWLERHFKSIKLLADKLCNSIENKAEWQSVVKLILRYKHWPRSRCWEHKSKNPEIIDEFSPVINSKEIIQVVIWNHRWISSNVNP